MSGMIFPRRTAKWILVFGCLMGSGTPLFSQGLPSPHKAAAPSLPPRSPREFLSSPREVLKTLYYAVVAYDLRPELMDEATACLALDPARAADPAEAARLAIELEQILRTLCVPLYGVPEKTPADTVTVLDGDGFKISIARYPDGLWRFDADTIDRIPAMSRAAQARFRDVQAERAHLKDEYTDPSATLRRFLLDSIARDFYSAARCLDLSRIDKEERGARGPLLARQLAFVMQRRGWLFLQEVPNHPNGPPCTWHADKVGRIVLERVRGADGKEAWLFSRKTVRNIPAMYEEARGQPADPRYVRLGIALNPLTAADDPTVSARRPDEVPANLGSPRAMLKGFFRVMDQAETVDARILDALEYLDLENIPPADRRAEGTKVAGKLDAVLRKISIDLSAIPDDWNAPRQVLGQTEGVAVEIVRQRDGCWRFGPNTVGRASAFFDKLAASSRGDAGRASHLDSARDTMSTFLSCMHRGDFEQAAECLDLDAYRPGTQSEMGAVLAIKLKFVISRLGRVYIQEVPDAPDGPPYHFYHGELGDIAIARQADGERKGCWLFTRKTVSLVEKMYTAVLDRPTAERPDHAPRPPEFWEMPGIWVRIHVPAVLQRVVCGLRLYQWLGLALAILVSALFSRLLLAQVYRLIAVVLHKSASALTPSFVAARLRPFTWVTTWWLVFQSLVLLDLPIHFIDAVLPLKTFGMAALIAWLGMQLVNLVTAVYLNSELLRPHRSLSDMIVPVSMRALKGLILLVVAVYVVYQIGQGESLNRFLTGLGVAGLAASLAAQDALKSFFGTLLLIGERSFRIGDRISLGGGMEGVVEQVGFRATRLRTTDGSLLTVPNSTMASAAIDNRSTLAVRRCTLSLVLPGPASPDRLPLLRDRIRAWLGEHPNVRPDKVEVSVRRLADMGVEVALDLYLTDASAAAEKTLKEAATAEIGRLYDSLGEGEVGYRHPLAGGESALDGVLSKDGSA
jgi:MscS family membrane protein